MTKEMLQAEIVAVEQEINDLQGKLMTAYGALQAFQYMLKQLDQPSEAKGD